MASSSEFPALPDRLFGPEMIGNPYPVYRQLRESSPVHWDPAMKAWVVTRYGDVAMVLGDKRFSSRRTARGRERFPQKEFDALFDTMAERMTEKDEPEHTRLRALVQNAFARAAMDEWRMRARSITENLLDAAERSGRFDFVPSFAIPLPLNLILEIVGIPDSDRRKVKAWSDDFANVALNFYANISEPDLRRASAGVLEFKEFLRERVRASHDAPRNDLLSSLIRAEEGGSRLTLEELLANTLLLLSAGNETTTCLLANGLLALLEQPDQLERLRQDSSLIPNAIEEFLRFESPVQFLGRLATEDVLVRDKTIRAGELVLAVIGSANRDPEHFENPDRLDVGRSHLQHMAFGHGHHFCAGAHLARLEATIAFEMILARFSSIQLDSTQPVAYRKNANIRCVEKLFILVAP
jgi:cytochrome P450